MEQLPGLAADAAAKLLTAAVKRPDGNDATAFNDQAIGLKAMRSAVIEHDSRLVELARFKEAMLSRPF